MKNQGHFKNRTFAVVIVFVFAAKTVFFADTKIVLAEENPETTLVLDTPPFEPITRFFGDTVVNRFLTLKDLATSGSNKVSDGVYAVGNHVISSTHQVASVGEAVADAAHTFYCTVSGWLGVECGEKTTPVIEIPKKVNVNVDVTTPPVINRKDDDTAEVRTDARKEYNSSDDDSTSNNSNIINQTVIVNGVTEAELERRLAIFRNSLDLSSGVTIINKSVEGSRISTDRIYDDMGETANEAAEGAVTGGNLSFNGINGTFSGDVSISGTLSVTGTTTLSGPLSVGGSTGVAGYVLQSTGTGAQWVATSTLGISGGGGGSGVDALAAIGSTANACGASISGTTLTLQPASATFGGIVTTGAQTFAGQKTFDVNFGVGTSTTNHLFHAYGTQGSKFTRTGNFTAISTVLNLLTADTGSLTDGEGPGLSFQVSDSDTTEVTLGRVSAARYGADNAGALNFGTADAGTTATRMTILPTGKVGIGTTNPDGALEVNLGTANAIRLSYDNSNGSAATYFDTTLSSTGVATFDTAGSATGFTFNDAVRLATLTSNGFVKTCGNNGTLSIDTTTYLSCVNNLSTIEVGNGNTVSAYSTSAALGYQNTLTSASSTAVGVSNTVSGICASAIGSCNIASGLRSSAVGRANTASALNSSSFGYNNNASECFASAFGYINTASGTSSSAFGRSNTASGISTSVFGISSQATGGCSTAIGRLSCSIGGYSFAAGNANIASSTYSTAVGYINIASATSSSAFGRSNTASGAYSTALGYCNNASTINSFSAGRSNFSGTGLAAVSLGILNNSTGANLDTATGIIDGAAVAVNAGCSSIAVGICNCATGLMSEAFGHCNVVGGSISTVLGFGNNIDFSQSNNVTSSVAVGKGINIDTSYAAVFGIGSYINSGGYSTAVGYGVTASGFYSSVFGSNIGNSDGNSVKIGTADGSFFQVCCVGPGASEFKFCGMSNLTQLGLDTDGKLIDGTSSDERLKNIDGSFDAGLDNLLQISPITYHWNDISRRDQSRAYSGFSAQNVLAAIPEAVTLGRDGYYAVQDRPILAASINAIKQLNTKALTTDALALQNAVEIASLKTLLGEQGLSEGALARFAQLDLALADIHVTIDEHSSMLESLSERIDTINERLESFGATVYESVVTFVDVVAKKITVSELIVNNEEHPEKTGLVIYDRKTGEPICVYFEEGVMKTQNGECEEVEEVEEDNTTDEDNFAGDDIGADDSGNIETPDENSDGTTNDTEGEGDTSTDSESADNTESDTPVTDEGGATSDESDTAGDASADSGVDSGSETGGISDSGSSTDTSDSGTSDTGDSGSDAGSDSGSDAGGAPAN